MNDKTKLQGRLAVASFTCGVGIASGCIFLVEPYGEITNSAITIVSELLSLAGVLLGAKVYVDTTVGKVSSRMDRIEESNKKTENT